jgi:hypothetical protein
MNTFHQQPKSNPLTSFMRQPKIYIRLPSEGIYWPDRSIVIPENKEIPVFSMTAKDELAFKTPDALMNGQAVVDVIQSCVPSIKDAWKCPNIDLDAILIAIRIATYGEMMDITHRVPVADEEVTHQIDLRMLLDQLVNNVRWDEAVQLDENLICFVRPLNYKHITLTSLKTFETQRLMQAVNDESLTDEKKLEIFNKSFASMTEITLDLLVDSIEAIKTPDTIVEDKQFIKEFLQNADNSIYQKVQDHIANMKKLSGIKPMLITATPKQIAEGAPETYELPVSIDNSDFFARGS